MIPLTYSVFALLMAVLSYYSISNVNYRKAILLLISLVFYAQFSPYYLIALLLTIVLTYSFGRVISKSQSKKTLVGGIILNILLLSIFKYNYIFGIQSEYFSYPIGLSFYVFQSISYLVDIYRRKYTGKTDIMDVALYLSFFPKILAGPIEKAGDIIPQFNLQHKFNSKNCFVGIKIIIYGLFCKFVLADGLGVIVDNSINDFISHSAIEIFIVSVFYTFQIYFDFFGYSILAIGVSKLFNISLQENFDRPYLSLSLKDFWSRWNITLYMWLRHYLYIPLGGNRVGKVRLIINILVVFIVSGIWHGATVNYLIWGFIHGILFVLELELSNFKKGKFFNRFIVRLVYLFIVYACISLLWLIFRIEDFDLIVFAFKKLSDFSNWFKFTGNVDLSIYVSALVTLVFILQGFNFFKKYIFNIENSVSFVIVELILINSLIVFLVTTNSKGQGFIYFNF